MDCPIEILNPGADARRARVVLFDFDGTLSLIRSGWVEVMTPLMVESLLELGTGESREDLTAIVEDYVARLTGKQTIYQMIELAEQVRKRGGMPLDPLEYKHIYLDRLEAKIKDRVEGLRSGTIPPDEMLVPGARRLLDSLSARGLGLYLASGTDEKFTRREAALLQIDDYFGGHIYGALDDYKKFSKKILIGRILDEAGYSGDELLAFGDGFVEIQNVKQVGGVAVGVASDEPECVHVDAVKRKRLAGVGADWIVANYNGHDELLSTLFPS